MNFDQGLYVTAMGMGLVFLSLGVLMGAMMLLDRLFPHREEVGKPEAVAATAPAEAARAPATASPGSQVASPAPQRSGSFDAILAGRTHHIELKDAVGQPMLVAVDGREYQVELRDGGAAQMVVDGRTYSTRVIETGPDHVTVSVGDEVFRVELPSAAGTPAASELATTPAGRDLAASAPVSGLPILAPLPGRILRVAIAAGDKVTRGQELCVIEAMKMENSIRAPQDGVIREVRARQGQSVAPGEVLAVM